MAQITRQLGVAVLRRLADARSRGDEGAIAILTAIVVVFLLIPLSAVAIGSYTRSGVGAEVHRGGDSGALAGASGLGLTNLGALGVLTPTVLNNPLSSTDPLLPSLTEPLKQACVAAQKAYGIATPTTTGTYGNRSFTTGPIADNAVSNANSPLGKAFGTLTGCKAQYTPDPIFTDCLGAVTAPVNTVLAGPVSQLSALLDRLRNVKAGLAVSADLNLGLGISLPIGSITSTGLVIVSAAANVALQGLIDQVQALLSQVTQLNGLLQSLLPALSRNGVTVDMTYTVKGPLDELLKPGGTTTATTRSAARRVFKPLLPSALSPLVSTTIGGAASGSGSISVNVPGLALDSALQLNATERYTVNTLQLVIATLRETVAGTAGTEKQITDLLANRNALVNSGLGQLTSTLNSVIGLLPSIAGQRLPTVPTLPTVDVPLPADLPGLITSITTPCRAAVDDLLDDLSDALTVNRGGDQDLLACVTQRLLGTSALPLSLPTAGLPAPVVRTVNGLTVPTLSSTPVVDAQACINRLFRAQIGPNPTYAQVPR